MPPGICDDRRFRRSEATLREGRPACLTSAVSFLSGWLAPLVPIAGSLVVRRNATWRRRAAGSRPFCRPQCSVAGRPWTRTATETKWLRSRAHSSSMRTIDLCLARAAALRLLIPPRWRRTRSEPAPSERSTIDMSFRLICSRTEISWWMSASSSRNSSNARVKSFIQVLFGRSRGSRTSPSREPKTLCSHAHGSRVAVSTAQLTSS